MPRTEPRSGPAAGRADGAAEGVRFSADCADCADERTGKMLIHLYGGKYEGHEVEAEEWQRYVMFPDIPQRTEHAFARSGRAPVDPVRRIVYRINWLTRSAVLEK